MMEVGPWRMNGKGGFQSQEGGWEEYTTMVFRTRPSFHILALTHSALVDQPAGTGFSYASTDNYVHTMDEVSIFITDQHSSR